MNLKKRKQIVLVSLCSVNAFGQDPCYMNWLCSVISGISTKEDGCVFSYLVFCGDGRHEEVSTYKYLGNVIYKIQNPGQDIFKENYSHLSNQAKKAMFGLKKTIQMIGQIPPHMMFELFEKTITPILSYGSDIWGLNQGGTEALDKVFLYFVRCVLQIKGTTSNVITLGEWWRVPPSVSCRASTICFMNRVSSMPDTTLVK